MMKILLASMVTMFAVSAIALPATAAKKCPDGKYYDESKRKCVTKRGS